MNTKKTQLLNKAYDEYIKLMLYDFPVERISEIVVNDVTGFGTTVDEKILELNRLTKIVTDQREQGAGIDMKISMIPLQRRISPNEDTALYMDEFEISMVVDGTDNILPVRVTSVFEFRQNAWKLVHLHVSKAVEIEEDTWHLNEWKQKSEQLQKLVDEKTTELIKQNRELEIEAALEKVRSSSLAMHNSNQIREIVKVVFEKLKDLKFAIDGGVFVGTIPKNPNHVNYWIGDDHAEYPGSFKIPKYDAPTITDVWDAQKSGVEFVSKTYSFKEKNIWFEYAFNHTDLKNALPEDFKKWILEQEYLTQSFAMQKNSMIGVHFHHAKTLTENEIGILKRFSRVFEQSYVRYLDLEKAEEQAREAQIEAALEKVRSRSLAMHKSDELEEVASVVLSKIQELNITNDGEASIILLNEDSRDFTIWLASPEYNFSLFKFNVPYADFTVFNAYFDAKAKGLNFLAKSFSFKEKSEFFEYLHEHSDFKYLPEDRKKYIEEQETYSLSTAWVEKSGIQIPSHTGKLLSEKEGEILKRFATVFEQSYIRFLDLQKAEAQARESQVQLALERVRARTMAMQKSNELLDAAILLFQQLKELQINAFATGFVLLDSLETEGEFWMSAEGEFQPVIYIPNTDEPIIRNLYNHWEKGDEYHIEEAGGETLKSHANYLRSLPKSGHIFREMQGAGIEFPQWQQWNAAYFRHGYLLAITKEPFEEKIILKRFAKVFEQTYTRFLDLQKAEAQAREAQIEAALEKVRSHSLAMHKSEELQDVVAVVFEKLMELGFELEKGAAIILIFKKGSKDHLEWIADPTQSYVQCMNIPYFENPLSTDILNGWENSADFYSKLYSFGVKNDFFNYAFENTDYKYIPDIIKESLLKAEKYSFSIAFEKNSAIGIPDATGKIFSEEKEDILKRFARVFEQAYIRFLDLQKAEAQAREAQIEACLERFRSRMLAMQKSSELEDTTTVMYQELNALGAVPNGSMVYIVIVDRKTDTAHQWIVSDKTLVRPPEGELKVPMNEHPQLIKTYEAWKRKEPLLIRDLSGEELENLKNYFKSLPSFQKVKSEFDQWPDRLVWSEASFSNGTLGLIFTAPLPQATLDILVRFSRVFDLTYTRFLDIQKAEAQAREAHIEAALERVRSKTMAMHNSRDVGETVFTMFDELINLGIESNRCGIVIFNETPVSEIWTAKSNAAGNDSLVIGYLDVTIHPLLQNVRSAWKRNETVFTFNMAGDYIKNYYQAINKYSEYPTSFNIDALPEKETLTDYYFTEGALFAFTKEPVTKEASSVYKRFAGVFGQTYRRYLDLKKAEAQAREAQIQLALERVRARTMAMQHSDELADVSFLLNKQVVELGIPTRGCAFNIYDEHDSTEWFSNLEGTLPTYKTPRENIFLKYYEAGQRGETLLIEEFGSERIKEHYRYLFSLRILEKENENTGKINEVIPEFQIDHVAFFKYGYLLFITLIPAPEAHDIFKRFAKEFEQTYTRFLDLKKAEAQARESEIELALERIRARTMAMQRSEELTDAAALVFHQIEELGIHQWGNAFQLWDDDMKAVTSWTCTHGVESLKSRIPATEDPVMINIVKAAQNGESLYVEEMGGEALENHYKFLTSLPVLKEVFEKLAEDGFNPPKFQIFHAAYFSSGYILFITHESVPEAHDIFKRFAKVFEQTYTRFLDLQKAEAQAREAQIEAALERVRSRSIAMRRSEEIAEIAGKIFSELRRLDLALNRVLIWTFNEAEKYTTWWSANPEVESTAESYRIDYNENPVFIKTLQAWQQRKPIHLYTLSGDMKKTWEDHLFEHTEMSRLPMEVRTGMRSEGTLYTISIISDYGLMMSGSFEPLSDANIDIIQRFGRVFQQSYTRYLDVQKAEAQAREAQIEAALERVRSRTMGMHQSSELSEVGDMLFQQIKQLGIDAEGSWFWFIDLDTEEIEIWVTVDGKLAEPITVSGSDFWTFNKEVEGWKNKEPFLQLSIPFQEAKELTHSIFGIELSNQKESALYLLQVRHKYGFLGISTWREASEEEIRISSRFAKVFEQTYTRFLDLKKAEAQAREAQIEAALERVRSRSMGMHQSNELAEVSGLLYQELEKLGIIHDFLVSGFNEVDEKNNRQYGWTTMPDGSKAEGYYLPLVGDPVLNVRHEAWKKQVANFHQKVRGDELKTHLEFVMPTLGSEQIKKMVRENFPDPTIFYCFNFKHGYLHIVTGQKLSEEYELIMTRFTKAFEQTYTRFLDLKKAEAQAREAEIQLALERVRARTMGMHRSDELSETAQLLFNEVQLLGIKSLNCGFNIFENNEPLSNAWVSLAGETRPAFKIPHNEDSSLKRIYKAWKTEVSFYHEEIGGKELQEHNEYMSSLVSQKENKRLLNSQGFELSPLPAFEVFNCAFFKQGYLIIITSELNSDNEDLFIRFAKVFEQTYTRFLDLQKAEIQAREAEIELALERVRAKTMSMKTQHDLLEVIESFSSQLASLGLRIDTASFVNGTSKTDWDLWIYSGFEYPTLRALIPYTETAYFTKTFKNIDEYEKSGKEIFSLSFTKEEKDEFLDHWFKHTAEIPITDEIKTIIYAASGSTIVHALLGNVSVAISKYELEPYTEEQLDIFKRFSHAFKQAYTRFLDLQKAEKQAREAQIEAALEKVRSRTMAMQKSEELADVATVLFQQVKALGVPQWTCGFNIWEIGDTDFTFYPGSPDGDILPPCKVPLTEDTIFRLFDESRRRGDELCIYESKGNIQKEHYRYMAKLPGGLGDLLQSMLKAGMEFPAFQIDHLANFSHGNLLFITYEHFPEMHDIFKRFAKVFEQTYTRFLDLQKAEAQAREAVKQASLDRVRGEIASMRSKDDLNRITPLIWKELNALGVPFIRCGVFIMDDENQNIHTFLSTPTGDSIAAFHLPYDTPGNFAEIVRHWKLKQNYVHHWGETEFENLAELLLKNGSISSRGQYMSSMPKEGIHLNFLPFLQGMLYVGNNEPLNAEDLLLLQSLANAFSTAYARYEDFNRLESAKDKIEHTLTELKATQSQLIQAEKMASLGQLTAGIAHEIQNPLNFVNNFSEVSIDLIDEMDEELVNGNDEEVKAIKEDLRQNLEKINHHGNRASSIVKGMLQHSRTSTGQKESTDMNALADEYLRLAYHGMRAKDKSFNADFKTEFDESLPKINVIPQDIGRVLLNLINNAFYAVNNKAKDLTPPLPNGGIENPQNNYKPTVTVTTSHSLSLGEGRGEVRISVKDNGNGIPSSIVDKIFQPFFTTKPTGQGTGLGLSLSYDIIKAHGGELKVETKEGQGSEFIIQIPIKST